MVFIKCLSLCSFAHASDEQIFVSHENLEVLYFQNMLRFTAPCVVLCRKLSISMRRKSFCERAHRLNPCPLDDARADTDFTPLFSYHHSLLDFLWAFFNIKVETSDSRFEVWKPLTKRLQKR